MEGSPFLPLSDGLHIEQVTPSTHELLVQVISSSPTACCPLCGVQAWRIHSRYTRQVADLPCAGRHITLLLTVRKFFCPNAACPRNIFAEQFPDLVPSYARLTIRLREALIALGLATSGEVVSRLAPRLGMQVAPTTLLRRLRAVPVAPAGKVRVLGVDDFAWKKGQTYGTILVDLELRRPIDLLPDRSGETLQAWLRAHPEVEIVSRDRGGEYAAAARKGAPQAQQVADRFHLLKNLRERLKELMDRKQSCLPEVEEQVSDAIPAKAQGIKDKRLHQSAEPQGEPEAEKRYRTIPPFPYQRPPGMSYDAFQKQIRRDKRVARYEDVHTLFEQGLSQRAVARKLKLSRATVRKFVQAETYPERHTSNAGARRSLLDPYKGYLLHRWQHGCRNSVQLYDEIKARGFQGSAPLRRQVSGRAEEKAPAGRFRLSPDLRYSHAVHRIPCFSACQTPDCLPDVCHTRPPFSLSAKPESWMKSKRSKSDRSVQDAPPLERAYHLSQEFVMMKASRRAGDMESWLTQAEHSRLPEFKKMATGIRQDYAAVKEAFSSEWSNGQVEAQVNCLKRKPRIVFGRANFDLLRLRVLRRA